MTLLSTQSLANSGVVTWRVCVCVSSFWAGVRICNQKRSNASVSRIKGEQIGGISSQRQRNGDAVPGVRGTLWVGWMLKEGREVQLRLSKDDPLVHFAWLLGL